MSQNSNTSIAVVGIDIGKNSFHVVGLDQRADRQSAAVMKLPSNSYRLHYRGAWPSLISSLLASINVRPRQTQKAKYKLKAEIARLKKKR